MSWSAWAAASLDEIRAAGRWREVRDRDGLAPELDGLVSFASNDYLGLTRHPAVVTAAHDALDRWGAGAGAARLVVGGRPVHGDLERELAAWRGTERAVLFPTGYAANLGVLTTVAGPGTTIVSDELNHASIIDGARLSRASVAVYRHADVEHAAKILADADRAVLVTDTVFSMDGDVAPVGELAAVCRARRALLVVDEAHGVLGPALDDGDLADVEVLRVGTLSKALGSLGGFVAGAAPLCDLLVNRARSFIFTTASTPADAAAALAAVRLVRSAEGEALRERLRRHVDAVRPGHPSPIVPILLGDEARAVDAAAALRNRGLLVPAIRPPTVAAGTSRLRIALSAAHTDAQVASLCTALDDLGLR